MFHLISLLQKDLQEFPNTLRPDSTNTNISSYLLIILFFPEPSDSKLQTWCPFTPKYLSVFPESKDILSQKHGRFQGPEMKADTLLSSKLQPLFRFPGFLS